MKKVISVFLCLALVLTAFAGCGKTETFKFGIATYTEITKQTDAEGDTNGIGEASVTAAAVLLDSEGKIVNCAVDTVAPKAEYTAEGKAVKGADIKSKYELKEAYGMAQSTYDVNGDGTVKEWFEQADIFCNTVKGKTIDEVKKMVAEDMRGDAALQTAGCTIMVSELVKALTNAAAKTTDVTAAKDTVLKLVPTVTAQTSDADAGVKGVATFKVEFAVEAEGIEDAKASDEVKFEFDQKGIAAK